MTVCTATGLIASYMRLCGFAGWSSFWGVIYVLPGHEHDRKDDFILPTSACCAT